MRRRQRRRVRRERENQGAPGRNKRQRFLLTGPVHKHPCARGAPRSRRGLCTLDDLKASTRSTAACSSRPWAWPPRRSSGRRNGCGTSARRGGSRPSSSSERSGCLQTRCLSRTSRARCRCGGPPRHACPAQIRRPPLGLTHTDTNAHADPDARLTLALPPQRTILMHGRLFVSHEHLCFASNVFGVRTLLVLPFREVSCRKPLILTLTLTPTLTLTQP